MKVGFLAAIRAALVAGGSPTGRPAPMVINVGLLLIAVGVVGCLSSGTEVDSGGPAPLFTDETGAIQGLVLSETLLPLAGVSVMLDDDNASRATTDAAGRFRIGLVEPGLHVLSLSHPGFRNHTQDVDVEAGRVTEAHFEMVSRPSAEPYVRVEHDTGFIGCTVTWRDPVVSPEGRAKAALCTAVAYGGGASSVDQSQIDYPPEAFDAIGDILGETIWVPTQALGAGLFVNYWLYHPDAHLTINDAWDVNWTAGDSPLKVRIPVERLDQVVEENGADCAEVCNMFALLYSYPQTATSSPVDVGVAVDQRFEMYRSTSFHARLSTDYTALPDS